MDDEYRLGWEIASEQILIDLVTLFLTVATVWIVWYVVKADNPDEVRHLQFFLTFIVAVIPFVILVYFGSAVIIYDAITAPPWPTLLPSKLSLRELLAAGVIYIGLTAWLWLRCVSFDTATRRGGSR